MGNLKQGIVFKTKDSMIYGDVRVTEIACG